MHPSTILANLAALPLAFSIPSRHYKRQDIENTTDNTSPISACSLSGVAQPPSTLTPPPAGTNLVIIAHGVGTQNYTCGTNLTAAPSSIGAIATLTDFSCSLSNTPNPASKASPPSPDAEPPSFGTVAESSTIGTHFFVDNTTPDFDIIGLGNTQMKKKEDCNAPNPAADIKWLLLTTQAQGTTSQVKMIYRLNTQGGLLPQNCEGRAAGEVVTVPYEAQYWVYAFESAGNSTGNSSVAVAPVAPQSPPQQPAAEQFLGAGVRGREVNGWMVLVSFALYMFCL